MSISGIGSSIASSMYSSQAASRSQKPDAANMASELFAMLDTSGKGYIEASDLSSALESSDSAGSAESLFSTMDADSDGKVTEQELSSLLQKVAEQLEDSFGAARVGEAMGNRPPPPPPGGMGGAQGEDEGLTVDQLSTMAEEAEASGNTTMASELSSLAESFEEADANQDGKVTFQEAQAYRESQSSESGDAASSRPAPPDDAQREERMLARVLEMLKQYSGNESSNDSSAATLSVSA
ncbi:EF-hand domain-containing protein [Methyloversatilis thermotolerans]|uniref:EF-hand domain-containing protein n=1 Tax=Methyloversatilis thermotolerans TaxID=1346290 RepID=UPI00035EE211|nr:EF-hand domain-containing protein [Methyloversatilis thermotolerans]